MNEDQNIKTHNSDEILDLAKISKQSMSEPSSKMRRLKGNWAKIVTVVGVIASLFHFYTAGYRPLPTMQQRPIHLAFVLFLAFLLYPASTKQNKEDSPLLIDFILAVIAAFSSFYMAYNYRSMVLRGGYFVTLDIIMGVLFCILLVEAARRTMGKLILFLSCIFVVYLFIGPILPGIFEHGAFSWDRVLHHMYMTTEGVFGIAVGVSATYVYLFVLFGAFLNKSGLTELFANLALAVAGHSPGGPAKVAIISSGLMGTIQGSSAANVAATGMFTIPLMKSLGFKGYFAAAVEAVASCGGQFLPPIMGASAFIMAEYLQVPYAYVAAGAALPAILYYAAVYLQVHLRAKKLGMEGIPRHRLPALKKVLLEKGHLLLPVIILIVLLIMQFTALFAAFISIISVVIISSLRKESRMSFLDIIDALVLGAKNVITTAVACAVVGFIVGSVSLAGIGMILTYSIVKLGGGSLLLTLLLAAGASVIMSQGLPTTSVYIINVTLIAPSLVQMGVEPMLAHLFTYYWGGVSAITPPVALAVYVGSGIAGSDVMKTGFTAMRLGMAAYLVPFYFVFWPSIVNRSSATTLEIFLAMLGGAVAIFCMAVLGEMYLVKALPWFKGVILLLAIILIISPIFITQVIALILALYVGISEYMNRPSNLESSDISGI